MKSAILIMLAQRKGLLEVIVIASQKVNFTHWGRKGMDMISSS